MTQALFFDFDGTLSDSLTPVWVEYQRVMKKLGLPEKTYQEFCLHVGKPWEQVLLGMWPDLDIKSFTENYRFSEEKVKSIEGVNTALNVLSEDYVLGLLTSRGRLTLEKHMQCSKVDPKIFSAIYTRDDTRRHKPDPRVFNEITAKLGLDKAEALYVGDSTVDALSARDAGIGFVGVLTGAAVEEDFMRFNVDFVDSVADLPDYLKQLP
ncbi:MAG: HAD-IA family hydrolase [Candidatus Altiarchaeales archaeon]|nr:HAD-IA family hydrolase [Candidatus Altiarchaeales archaeon]